MSRVIALRPKLPVSGAVFSSLLALDMASGVPHAGFFDPLFAFAATPDATDAEVEEFLGSEGVNDRTDEDKTLVLAVTPWLIPSRED